MKKTPVITEVLSKAARRQMSIAMKKNSKKIQQKKQIALKKKASLETLKARSIKQARNLLAKKLLKGKNPAELSISQKENLEKILKKKSAGIKKIAKKLLPQIKKAEDIRIKDLHKSEGELSDLRVEQMSLKRLKGNRFEDLASIDLLMTILKEKP